MPGTKIKSSKALQNVRYEIRGQLANHALELEKRGYEVVSLNIGDPGLFGFRTPETMRLAMIEKLGQAEPYCHQKGIFPAREAVVMQQQDSGAVYDRESLRNIATLVEDTDTLDIVFDRIETCLAQYA